MTNTKTDTEERATRLDWALQYEAAAGLGVSIHIDGAGGDHWRTWSTISSGHYLFTAYSLGEAQAKAEAWHLAKSRGVVEQHSALVLALGGERKAQHPPSASPARIAD